MFYIEYLHEVIDLRTYSNTGILLWIVSIIVNKHLACFVLEKWFISIFFHYFQRTKELHICGRCLVLKC